MSQSKTFRSKKEFVYETLREQILEGELAPGLRLITDELSARLNVSPIPVREALQQLQYEGFVTIEPFIGATVTEIHTGLIHEIFALLEALEAPTRDDRKAIATWKLQATQGVGDQDAFAAAIETFLAEGFADPENVGAMHRQLAAYYSGKKDNAKTLEHFEKFVQATPDVQIDEYETLGRLYLQAGKNPEACETLGKAIDQSKSPGLT